MFQFYSFANRTSDRRGLAPCPMPDVSLPCGFRSSLVAQLLLRPVTAALGGGLDSSETFTASAFTSASLLRLKVASVIGHVVARPGSWVFPGYSGFLPHMDHIKKRLTHLGDVHGRLYPNSGITMCFVSPITSGAAKW